MSPPRVNPIRAAWQIWKATRIRPPRPGGSGTVDHAPLEPVLVALRSAGLANLDGEHARRLAGYVAFLEQRDPDLLAPTEALAYWLNLYNAAAVELALEAYRNDADSVLRLNNTFTRPVATIAGRTLSMNDIEHGKLRRFGDPRIHFAIACGSLSCPTLRPEPFRARDLDEQLEDQSRHFFATGGVEYLPEQRMLKLSRILRWYGGDFTRPHRMPAWIPPRSDRLVDSVRRWLPRDIREELPEAVRVGYLDYDWTLGCAIA